MYLKLTWFMLLASSVIGHDENVIENDRTNNEVKQERKNPEEPNNERTNEPELQDTKSSTGDVINNTRRQLYNPDISYQNAFINPNVQTHNPLHKYAIDYNAHANDRIDYRPNRVNSQFALNRYQNDYPLQDRYAQKSQHVDREPLNSYNVNRNYKFRSKVVNRYDQIEEQQQKILQQHPYFKSALRAEPYSAMIPNYVEALDKFDQASEELHKHLVFDKNMNKEELHYLTILSVIDLLTRNVMKCLGDSEYHNTFYELTNKAILEAISYPQGISRRIKYKLDDANSNVAQMRDLINNPYVRAACQNVSTTQCDAIILAVMHVAGNKVLLSQADLLIHLGQASALFLDNYSHEFQSVASSKHEVEYVLAAVHRLKPLVDKLAKSLGLIHPDTSCENRARMPQSD